MNEAVFKNKYLAYKQTVFNICISYLKSFDDAEDVMQEIFIKFYQIDKKFSQDIDEKYYLIRMTINSCINWLRKHKRIYRLSDSEICNLRSTTMIEDMEITDMISILDSKYKAVVILKYAENLSMKEISSSLGIKESNVRKRLQRAIEILKKEWEVNPK